MGEGVTQWGKTIRVSEEMYRRLDALRLTDKGKVGFEDVFKWLLEEKKRRK